MRHARTITFLGLAALALLGVAQGCGSTGMARSPAETAASQKAFLALYPVLMHPRCLNCHPAGDAPLQGDDSHVHSQNVKRGADGKGLFALKCANCHQDANVPGADMPPGNPKWHLPSADMPLVFEGRSASEIARQLVDPAQNGGKSVAEIVRHMTEDGLVLGAWNPGDGRRPPPMSHEEFARHVRTWAENGAAAPE